MSIEEKRKEIENLIEIIKEQSDKLSGVENISEDELKILLSKSAQLRDAVLILEYMITNNDDQLKDQSLTEEESIHDVVFENFEESIIQDDVVIEENEEVEESVPAVEEGKVESNGKYEGDLVESEEELISLEEIELKEELSSKPDVNETFSETGDDSVSDQLQKQPIRNLLSAIALNERYLYSNELFDGDIEDFRRVMGLLNEFETGEEAIDFFENELRKNYSWDEENELAKALSQLVERRFQL